jgi:hypothetical protein
MAMLSGIAEPQNSSQINQKQSLDQNGAEGL